ncbi:MAG TPA: carboxypeptidase-like regulatory domain-containing protein [bacterium]|nr:carboxypeptidase-like regulatory domain-containing protein [bacterium]
MRCSGSAHAGAVFAALFLWIALGISTAACAAAASGAAEAGMIGEIGGSVVDHTPPAHPVAAQPVRLQIVEPTINSTRATTTDAQGRFAFTGLPVGGPRVFLIQVEYGGVPYTARVVLSAAAPVRDVPMSVFVATPDRTAVHGTVVFAVFELFHDALRVSVVEEFDNVTDQAVAVTDEDPLVFPLPRISPPPRAAAPVEFVGGWRDPRVEDNRITDTIPILPGITRVAYVFGVETRAPTATLRWEFPYGATDVELLADPSLRVSGPDLRADGIVTERGRRYARWSGDAVPSGGSVSVRIEGLPVLGDRWPEIAAGGLALVLACGLVVALRRGPAPQGRSGTHEGGRRG